MDLEKESPPNKDFILLSTYVSIPTINNRGTINNDNKITSTTFTSISYCTSNNIKIKDFESRAKVEVDFINGPGPISDSCTFNILIPIHKFTTNNESTCTTNSCGNNNHSNGCVSDNNTGHNNKDTTNTTTTTTNTNIFYPYRDNIDPLQSNQP